MQDMVAFGAIIVVIGGILQGTFAVPMKYTHGWKWENTWLVFALSGLVVFPWILTMATVHNLGEVYSQTSSQTMAAIVFSGVGWGVGATLTGIGLTMLGIGLGLAIILGLSASVGSLVPLLILTPEKLQTEQGAWYLAGTAVMLVGIGLSSRAGALREKTESAAKVSPHSFLTGFLMCTAAGLLSSMLNFAFAFGTEAVDTATKLGVPDLWVGNVVTAPATAGGFLANLIYCGYLLHKNKTYGLYTGQRAGTNWVLGSLMGAFWFGGLTVYGIGVARMGVFGTVAGWPLLMGAIIVSSNLAGVITGEWKGTDGRTRAFLAVGTTVIIAALVVLAQAQTG